MWILKLAKLPFRAIIAVAISIIIREFSYSAGYVVLEVNHTMTNNLLALRLARPLCKYLFLVSILFCVQSVDAQNIAPNVANAYGYQFERNGVYIDASIGELAVSTLNSASFIVTQGYLQPISIEQPCSNPELVYYPNPVVEKTYF